MFKRSVLSILIFFTCIITASAQVTQKDFDFLSKYYNTKYKELLTARGINADAYFSSKYLEQNNPSKIVDVMRKYYEGSGVKIGTLIYFHYNATFTVYLADTRKIVKLSERKITKAQLTGINAAMLSSLRVAKGLGERTPRLRGARVEGATKALDFDSLNAVTSKLLLPNPVLLSTYEHLIIVPCLNLGAFPFYLLKMGDKTLVDHLSYTIAPSLIEVEASCRKNVERKRGDLGYPMSYSFDNPLLVANPAYPKNSKLNFPDLPGSKKEVEASLKYFEDGGYTYYSGEAATKQNILRNFTKHDLLYFATHGLSSSTNPLDSCFLVLAGEQNSFLTNKEILRYFDSATKMDLVILSACQTALGRSMDAGIIGLSRAFQIAGANHVVMSLWNVDDEATAYLMQRFLMYVQMSSRFFPAEPMRKAILATKLKYPDPSKWASFAVFGVPY